MSGYIEQKPLRLWCPVCENWVDVWAVAYQVDIVRAPLLVSEHGGKAVDISLDWDNMEVEAEYRYECPNMGCHHVFHVGHMSDLDELLEKDIHEHGDPSEA